MPLDRTGEPVEPDDADRQLTPAHDALCINGWLPDDADGRAQPCLVCRPWLAGRRDRLHRHLTGRTPAMTPHPLEP